LFLLLFPAIVAPLPIVQPPAFASSTGNPNPKLSPPAWLTPHKPGKPDNHFPVPFVKTDPKVDLVNIPPVWQVPMSPATLTLTSQAQHFLSNDGHLEMTVSAGTISDAQVKAAGGSITLTITQVLPGSGGLRSEHIFFGTYTFQLRDATGVLLSALVLAHPLALSFHLFPSQASLLAQGETVYAIWQGGDVTTHLAGTAPVSQKTLALPPTATVASTVKRQTPRASATATTTPRVPVTPTASPAPASSHTMLIATGDRTGLVWRITTALSTDVRHPLAQSSSSITFGTQAPQATWGSPQDFQVDVNSGGLLYNYPLTLPPGPGGLTPPVTLAYSSGAVNESHNVQAAAPWVGEGWNLSLGSISWGQENVTPGGTNRLENVWHISDATGIGGQLIPPDTRDSTNPPYYPSPLPGLYLWHTAPESHARVNEILANNVPCWNVWLPNGIREDFGCTNDSRQTYLDSQGHSLIWRWDLDAMIDAHGNQIHVHYQQVSVSSTIRDAVISSIDYDDPTCHDAVNLCSSWHPQVILLFDATHQVANASGGTCGNGSSTARCDDPVDVSGGLPAPKVFNTFVLNDIKVQVQGRILHKYTLYYEQSSPTQITDPATGEQESVSGYLDLTKIAEEGTDGSSPDPKQSSPVVTITYQGQTEYYLDYYKGTYTCGPSWMPCDLWSQSYNARYIQLLDNGRGWHETITWANAHNNTRGVDNGSGYANDPLACNGHQSSGNDCGSADDQSWSRIVVVSRTAVSNSVTSTWQYTYYLQTGLGANFPGSGCPTCHQGYTWGNQNDLDYADYYNGQFMSFLSVRVIAPDSSYHYSSYGATTGWGLAENGISCYLSSCVTASYFQNSGSILASALAGKEVAADDFATDNQTLLARHLWTYALLCPSPGAPHSTGAGGPPYDPGNTQLISQLDENNPVVVCDPRVSQENIYQVDGTTRNPDDSTTVHQTISYSYDGDNGSGVSGYDYGNLNETNTTGNDIYSGYFLITHQKMYPNDSIGNGHYHYLTNLPAITQVRDGAERPFSCNQAIYGSNSNATSPPTVPDVTQAQGHTVGDFSGCADNSNLITVQHTFDTSGNALTAIDGDTHLGCTSGSSTYSACATYDSSTYGTHLLTATNARNQTTTYSYDATSTGGFGEWLTATTDANAQTTSYQYDVLGRLVGIVRPGDSSSNPTISSSYLNGCTNGGTTPCLELDTTTQFVVGGPTTTMKQWYDGWGHLVETQVPSPTTGSVIVTYAIYDTMNRPIVKSLPYAIADPSGYSAPDQTKARSVTRYDELGRSLGSVTYDNSGTIVLSTSLSYKVATGVTGISADSANLFEQTIALDGYNHQSITYTDALGRVRYTQVFSGEGSPYSMVRTVYQHSDYLGNSDIVQTYDSTGTIQANYIASFDALSRRIGFNDSDLGSCSNTPLPAGCSSSSDLAWKFNYDADGNQLSSSDPRNKSVYIGYDLLDRPLCRGTAATDVSPTCQNTAYATFFYDSYDNTSNPGVSFPSGCAAPSGSYASDPIGHATAEHFVGNGNVGSGWRCDGYDQRGQLDQSGLSVTADGQTTTQSSNLLYNDGGEVTGLVYPDGETVTSQYDSNGRFQSSYVGTPSTPDPVPFLVGSTSYTPWGQISGTAIGGSGPKASGPTVPVYTTAVSYDGIQRLQGSSATRNSRTFWSQTRTYDNVGNVLGLSTTVPTQGGGTKTDVQAFCYDALNRLAWAGNTGTPSGGDHCMTPPSGTTLATYHQAYSFDNLDRLTNGEGGTVSYTDSNHTHAATRLGSVPNLYANYDAMGNMTCRNIDPTNAHTCAIGNATGASMTYDVEGRLDSWTAPNGTTASDKFLYDNAGNRVLQRTSTSGTVTDTITFDGFTETSSSGGNTTTMKYYSAHGQRVAMKVNGTLSYLLSDGLGSATLALNSDGSGQALQLFSPYGTVRFSWGTMPTTYNFTGQRLDSQTGLLYYNFRYYDPVSGRFVRADTVETNASGMDGYAYAGESPESRTDATGHDPDPITITIGVATLVLFGLVYVGIGLLIGSSILIAIAPSGSHGSGYSPTGPQPEPVPTPSPGATPSTDTSGGMCRAGGCYNLTGDEGISAYSFYRTKKGWGIRKSEAHTIARHVTISDADLRARADEIGTASKFYSLNTAEWAIQYAFDHMTSVEANQLASLVGNPSNVGQSVTVQVDTGEPIGYSYTRGNPFPVVDTGVSVTWMIGFDGTPFVLTSYPTYVPPPSGEQRIGPPGNIR